VIPTDTHLYLPHTPQCGLILDAGERLECVTEVNKLLYAAADGSKALHLNQHTNKEGAGAEYYASRVQELLGAGQSTSPSLDGWEERRCP
jgi:hypothetical protein